MHRTSFFAWFLACILTSVFAFATTTAATTISVNGDTTITTSADGADDTSTGDDANGGPGAAAVVWLAPNADVLIDPGLTFSGGDGAPGGLDAANDGGSDGGAGANAFHMWQNAGTVTATGLFVFGG